MGIGEATMGIGEATMGMSTASHATRATLPPGPGSPEP